MPVSVDGTFLVELVAIQASKIRISLFVAEIIIRPSSTNICKEKTCFLSSIL